MKKLLLFMALIASLSMHATEKVSRFENENWVQYSQTIYKGAERYIASYTHNHKLKTYVATLQDANNRWHKHPMAAKAQQEFEKMEKFYKEQTTATTSEENKQEPSSANKK